MTARASLIVALGLLIAACASDAEPVRVGAKDFAEQAILAETLAALVRADGTPAEVVRCGDTWACRAALADGSVDLMPEYTGTVLRFAGLDPHVDDAPARINAAYASLGTTWVGSLGFENAYRLYVTPERARLLTAPTIASLGAAGPLVFTAPPEFVRRPGDGLGALAVRHGIAMETGPLLIRDPMERYRAALDGRADVVVGYTTDGALLGLDLIELQDTLTFFPAYDAGLMARTNGRLPASDAARIAGILSEHLDESTMQRLNFSAEVEGRRPAAIATEFLRERGLLPETGGTGVALSVVRYPGDLEAFETAALVAVRAAFEGRPTEVVISEDATEAVVAGAHRLALVGAERFFVGGERDDRLEAAAVVGQRLAHLLVRVDGPGLEGGVGLPNESDSVAAIADALVPGVDVAFRGSTDELLDALAEGRVGAVLFFAAVGHRPVREALANGGVRLAPVAVPAGADSARRMPFLMDARIPADEYPGMTGAIDTVGAQVVLAAVSRGFAAHAASGGPATALPATGAPLSRAQVDRLAGATGAFQAPHPALPSAWTPPPAPVDEPVFSSVRALDTSLNVLTIAFLFFVAIQMLRPRPPKAA